MLKKFLEWIGLKERLHSQEHLPPFFKEGEVWWCYVGENIGVETNGKSGQFTRPVFIFKKYDKYSFLGLPLTTKSKTGSWYARIEFGGIMQTVILSQGRTFDYRRFKEKMGQLEEQYVRAIKIGYGQLHSLPIKK